MSGIFIFIKNYDRDMAKWFGGKLLEVLSAERDKVSSVRWFPRIENFRVSREKMPSSVVKVLKSIGIVIKYFSS